MQTKRGMACDEIARSLVRYGITTRSGVMSQVRRVCSKYSLDSMPRNHEIISRLPRHKRDELRPILVKKPVKTGSGVAVIALMPAPYACPHGRCSYCPGGKKYNTPNSYTGDEPAAMSAMAASYDPKSQVRSGLERLERYGHSPEKTELVIVGGTFLFMPEGYRRDFIKSCFDALNGFDSPTLEDAKTANQTARIRNVGFTIETKPDYCKGPHIDEMLGYGVTRVEIGVQTLQESVYDAVNRGHSIRDVYESFQVAKDSGYKIVAHMMPGLPSVTPEQDAADLLRLFEDERYRPDMLKIYPTLVIRGTKLHDEYVAGRYKPHTDEEITEILIRAKRSIPPWVRIMRVQREIPSSGIVAGPRIGNLRQAVLKRMAERGLKCRCIRCREAGSAGADPGMRLKTTRYASSGGEEAFISYESEMGIYGFLRLRMPHAPHRPEIKPGTALVRELHVYGRSLGLGKRGGIQHRGLGGALLSEAERISSETFGAKKLAVISAVGTREYYHNRGYGLDGPYMSRTL